MGVLTDFFVASASDAARYDEIVNNGQWGDEEEDPSLPKLERAEHKGFTGIELSALWALIDSEQPSAKHQLIMGPMHEESEAIVEQLPSAFVRRLAQLTDAQLSALSSSWAGVEGNQHEPGQLMDVLADLRRLAQSALGAGKNLYIWYAM
jgi:hypothetical protein